MKNSNHIRDKLNNYRQILSLCDPEIRVAMTTEEVNNIETHRDRYYRVIFPQTYKNKPDPYYANGIHCYISDEKDRIIGSVSLAFDGPVELPDSDLFAAEIASYKRQGMKYVQMGRMLVVKCARHEEIRRRLYKFVYLACRAINIDKVLTLSKTPEIPFAENVVGGRTVVADTGKNYGGLHNYAAFEWTLDKTLPTFFEWLQEKLMPPANPKVHATMAHYSETHLTVTPAIQVELYRQTVPHLSGEVLDVGCGSGKLAPYLADDSRIVSYTGLDREPSMLIQTNKVLRKLGKRRFNLRHGDILSYRGGPFDSVAFLLGLQFCHPQEEILNHIYDLLKPGGTLVLAVPNQHQDLTHLEKEVRKELIGHPHIEAFVRSNLALAKETVKFIDMVELKQMVLSAGYDILLAHSELYLGGLSFLVLKKAQ